MNSVSVTRQYRIRQAAFMIKACHDSGLLVKDWFQENDVSKDTYYVFATPLLEKGSCRQKMENVASTKWRKLQGSN